MQGFLPSIHWLRNYKLSDLPKDLIAGITVGVVIVPQGMAYAMLAGLPPEYGLYAALVPLLIYLFMGTSRQLAIGPVALDSLLVAVGLGSLGLVQPENYIVAAIFLAFLVGLIQFLFGLLRMGFLVNFLSKPVISGFTSAAALIIIVSQLKHLLGVKLEGVSSFNRILYSLAQKAAEINIFDLSIGLLGILLLLAMRKLSRRIPAVLLVVILGIVSVYLFKLEGHGVQVVGHIPSGLPEFQLPAYSMQLFLELWPFALTLALVGYLEAISIAKGIADKNDEDTLDANQELLALGTGNMAGSLFQSYPVTAGFSRTAVNYEAGARTNLFALFTVILVVITLLFLTPLFYFLPNAVLASIIIVAVIRLIDLAYAADLWRRRKDEFAVLFLTFLLTLLLGITQGILIGILFSLLLMVYRTSKPHFAVLGNIKGSDYYKNINRFDDKVEVREDLLIVRFDSQMYFGNANYFKNQLSKFIAKKGPALKAVILNAEAINYIDASSTQMLIRVIRELHTKDIS
ncbi:MAG: sulfate permease, partial [Bacteroidota bacterium]